MSHDHQVLDGAPPSAETRLSEAHHRIANNLALIAGFARLQATSVTKDQTPLSPRQAAAQLHEIGARIETVGRLHRLLSQHPSRNGVDIGAYLRATCEALAQSAAFGDAEALITYDTDADCILPADQASVLALIVNELVTNALKYAHPSGVIVQITISCGACATGLDVTVADDGVGLPEGFDPERDGGLGLRVVRSLAQQLKGMLAFDTEGLGLTVRLHVPLGEPATTGK